MQKSGFLTTRLKCSYTPQSLYNSMVCYNKVLDITKVSAGPEMIFQDYRNDPMFSDTWVWANSADPDQTAPRGAV